MNHNLAGILPVGRKRSKSEGAQPADDSPRRPRCGAPLPSPRPVPSTLSGSLALHCRIPMVIAVALGHFWSGVVQTSQVPGYPPSTERLDELQIPPPTLRSDRDDADPCTARLRY